MKNLSFAIGTEVNNVSSSANRFNQPDWIVAEAFNVVAIFCMLWIGLSFVVYGIRHDKWRKGVTNIAEINARSVYTATVTAVLCALVRLGLNQAAFNVGYGTLGEPCETTIGASAVFYALTTFCVFLVLWLKQFYLYRHIAAIQVLDRWLSYAKWGTLLLTFSSGTVATVAFVYPGDLTGSTRGCVTFYHENTVYWPLYLAFGTQMIGQLLLIGLFVYPLRIQMLTSIDGPAMRILKRSAAVAVAMTITDLLLAVVSSIVIPPRATQQLKLTVFDLNMCLNLFCVVLSFDSWRKIIACMLVRK